MGGEHDGICIRASFNDFPARCRRLRRVEAIAAVPFGIGHLNRMVHAIPGEDRAAVRAVQMQECVARRMAGRRFDIDGVFQLVAVRDHHRLACLDDRQDAVVVSLTPRITGAFRHFCGFPMGILVFMEQVLGVGEGRDPAAVLEFRVPTDMVDMQVGAHHEVDAFRRHAHRDHIFEEWAVLHMPGFGVGPMLMIADAGIDEDRMLGRLDNIAVQAHQKSAAVRVDKMGIEPVATFGFEGVRIAVGKDKSREKTRSLGFDATRDCRLPEMQCFHHDNSHSSSGASLLHFE